MTNPMGFPVYTQDFTLRFATPEAAEKSVLQIRFLPAGKTCAYTERWDDTNWRAGEKTASMARHGVRGTFFLNDVPEDFAEKIMRPAVAMGMAAGNHAMGHPLFPTHSPNHLFETVVLHHGLIESMLDTTVISFTLPCGTQGCWEWYETDLHQLAGELFQSAGIYCHPETHRNFQTLLKRAPDRAFGTYLFSADDRNADPEKYRTGFRTSREQAERNPDIPRVTFGIHPLQTDEGLKRLEGLYEECLNDPALWICHENEYGAYRYHFYHASIEKYSVSGDTAHFRITRFEPAFTGAETVLTITSSEPVLSGTGIRMNGNEGLLPESAGHTLPEKIDRTESGKESVKFPGLECTIESSGDLSRIQVILRNGTQQDLENVHVLLQLPPACTPKTLPAEIPLLKAGSTFEKDFRPDAVSTAAVYQDGRTGIGVRTDFIRNGKRGRLHTFTYLPYERKEREILADTVIAAGPFESGSVPESFCRDLSASSGPAAHPGHTPEKRWYAPRLNGAAAAFTLTPGRTDDADPAYEKAIAPFADPVHGELLSALEFRTETGRVRIAAEEKNVKVFWVDGTEYHPSGPVTELALTPGKHRLVLLSPAPMRWSFQKNGIQFGICDDVPPNRLCACFRIPFED